MQQGPVSPEVMREKVQALVQTVAAKQAIFEPFIVKDKHDQVDENKTLIAQAGYLKLVAAKSGISLNDTQAKRILQQAGVTADEILSLQDKPRNPNTRLAIQMALATSLALVKPSVSALILGNYAARQGAHYLLDSQLGIFNGAIETVIGLLNMTDYLSFTNLGMGAVASVVDQHPYLSIIAIPLAMLAYVKGPEFLKQLDMSRYNEAAGDLVDMMGGFADDETLEKYRGSLATMTLDEVASCVTQNVSSVLHWAWNKVPAIRTPATAPATPAQPDISSTLRY